MSGAGVHRVHGVGESEPCGGCLAAPDPLCAVCGRLAVTCLEAGEHALSLCDWCAFLLLRERKYRADCAEPLHFLPLTRTEMPRTKPQRGRHVRTTSAPPAA